jgi:hypothetical protein
MTDNNILLPLVKMVLNFKGLRCGYYAKNSYSSALLQWISSTQSKW